MPGSGRHKHAMVASGSTVFIIGGIQEDKTTSSCLKFEDDRWIELASMCVKRHSMTCASLDDYIYAFGGQRSKDRYLDSIERYNIKENKWEMLEAKLPKACASQTAIVIGEDSVVLIGGENADENLSIPHNVKI